MSVYDARRACLGADPQIFTFDVWTPQRMHTARRYCDTCPVKEECATDGITGREWGVWGGLYLQDGEVSGELMRREGEGLRECQNCGGEYFASRKGGGFYRYCSTECRRAAAKRREIARQQKAAGGLRPHGTHAAFARHKAAGEEPCEACVWGERDYNAEKKRLRRAAS